MTSSPRPVGSKGLTPPRESKTPPNNICGVHMADTLAASAEFSRKAKPVAGPELPARAWRTAVQVVTQAGLVSRRASHAVYRASLNISAAARFCDAAMGSNAKPVPGRHYRDRGPGVFGVEVVGVRYLVGDASSVAK